ncbi:potassium channel family protein [Ideonella sp.]|uniref:potassium channel family protein n=1 Tax=Ideonella sp. TaxID=1929293 RepID=UPI0035B11A83
MNWGHLALDSHSFAKSPNGWWLLRAPRDNTAAARSERLWRWPVLLALLATIPAFYAQLMQAAPPAWTAAVYAVAALVVALALRSVSRHTHSPAGHVRANPLDLLLIVGLSSAAWLPASSHSAAALALRLTVAFVTLWRMVWAIQHLITRGGLGYLLLVSVLVLGACGVGFWWIEPTTPNLGAGLWLAFTTAATVGYGDLVPTTPAARIFAVFVVLLGYGVLTLVTAAIASRWVETGERRIEHEILHDMRREMAAIRLELAALRDALPRADDPAPPPGPAVQLDVRRVAKDQ